MPIALVMAGGKGERLWPVSRRHRPKQFISLLGKTLLRHTVERILPLVGVDRLYVVTQREHLEATLRELPFLPPSHLIFEPVGKNTAPCIGFSAVHLARVFSPGEVMVVLPADHMVFEEERFQEAVSLAVEVAQSGEWLVTFGIPPTHPHTGYGYIRCGELFRKDSRGCVYRGEGFTEKPDLNKAEEYLRSGKYLWNSGIFVWTIGAILSAFKTWAPEISWGLEQIAESLGTPKEEKVLVEVFSTFPSISIDYAVMERASNILVVSASFGWSDVGSWKSLGEILPKDANGNVALGEHIALESRGCILWTRKPVVTFGMEDVVLVEEEDLLFLAPKSRDQDIRRLLAYLRETGRTEYL
ncbi:mannose-1-phosphate guanylyltransferase [Candidatus Caldatribacterium sp. SIUC1]|uniref:mannose-1-phosphate guanylyltransferase n=1 Tax=Candidatus Caldatribacterium sp. SIUC1 TaxID=3418365 RepID=UPI003F68BED0